MSKSEQETGNVLDMRAAALKYDSSQDSAPIVVAAGSGYVAQRILEIADQSGVSIYHDDSAATLLSKLELGRAIPPELYQLVVEIYLTVIAAADAAKKASLTPNAQAGGNIKRTAGNIRKQ